MKFERQLERYLNLANLVESRDYLRIVALAAILLAEHKSGQIDRVFEQIVVNGAVDAKPRRRVALRERVEHDVYLKQQMRIKQSRRLSLAYMLNKVFHRARLIDPGGRRLGRPRRPFGGARALHRLCDFIQHGAGFDDYARLSDRVVRTLLEFLALAFDELRNELFERNDLQAAAKWRRQWAPIWPTSLKKWSIGVRCLCVG